jgi:hypothetical protein
MDVYVATRFVDAEGPHERGEKIDFPRNTPEEKANLETLIGWGILSTRKIDPDSDGDTDSPYVQPYQQPQG